MLCILEATSPHAPFCYPKLLYSNHSLSNVYLDRVLDLVCVAAGAILARRAVRPRLLVGLPVSVLLLTAHWLGSGDVDDHQLVKPASPKVVVSAHQEAQDAVRTRTLSAVSHNSSAYMHSI